MNRGPGGSKHPIITGRPNNIKNDQVCNVHGAKGEKLCTKGRHYEVQWVLCHQRGRYNASPPSVLERGTAYNFLTHSYMLNDVWNRPILRMKKKGGGNRKKKEEEEKGKEKREGEN